MANIKIAQLTNQTAISDTDLVIVETATSTNKMTVANLKEQLGINAKASKNPLRTFTTLPLAGGVTGFIKYHKDEMGLVTVIGEIKVTNVGVNSDVAIGLPAGIVPNSNFLPLISINWNTGEAGAGFFVSKDGSIKVSGSPNFNAGDPVSFEVIYVAV